MLKLPPLWALGAALILNRQGVQAPHCLLEACRLLGAGVPGLMMLSLGMALRFPRSGSIGPILSVIGIKLIASPLAVWFAARLLGMEGTLHQAVTLEGAMPTQLLTLVIADRYGLDSATLALVVGLDTALSFFTIPLVQGLLF